jgi:hypothetical protein
MSKIKNEIPTPHIESFKSVIDLLREHASNAFVSVKEFRLKKIIDDSKVSIKYRGDIMDYLKAQGYLIIQGERSVMRYKFVEGETKVDSLKLANEAYRKITSKPYVRKKHYRKMALPAEKKEILTPVITKKDYTLRDAGFFMKDDIIMEGRIIGSFFALEDDADETETHEVEIKEKVDYEKTYYHLVVLNNCPLKGTIIKNLDKGSLYSSIDLLLNGLKIKFHARNKVKTV